MENEAKKQTQGEEKTSESQQKTEPGTGETYPIQIDEIIAMARQLEGYHNTLTAIVCDIAVAPSLNDSGIYVESESATAEHCKRLARTALGIPQNTPLKKTYMPLIRKRFPLLDYLLPRPVVDGVSESPDPERQDHHHESSEKASVAQ